MPPPPATSIFLGTVGGVAQSVLPKEGGVSAGFVAKVAAVDGRVVSRDLGVGEMLAGLLLVRARQW